MRRWRGAAAALSGGEILQLGVTIGHGLPPSGSLRRFGVQLEIKIAEGGESRTGGDDAERSGNRVDLARQRRLGHGQTVKIGSHRRFNRDLMDRPRTSGAAFSHALLATQLTEAH